MGTLKIIYRFGLSLALFGLASCVREGIEPCPPLRVDIAVKDKNYFNVDKVELEERLSEDLPFRTYIPTLYYQLRDASTGKIVEERGLTDVSGEGKTYSVTFCDCLPHGTYVLTVWGGHRDGSTLADDGVTATLHEANREGDDLYLTNDTLVYDAWNYDYTVEMERAKGKLIIQAVGLPDGVSYSGKSVSGLYHKVTNRFDYMDETSVYTRAEWGPEPEVVTKTVLSPSLREYGSLLKMGFYDKPERTQPVLIPDDVGITMSRNMLTVLKYVYDGRKFTIYILINDNWERLHSMDID